MAPPIVVCRAASGLRRAAAQASLSSKPRSLASTSRKISCVASSSARCLTARYLPPSAAQAVTVRSLATLAADQAKLSRSDHFAKLEPNDVEVFAKILSTPASSILTTLSTSAEDVKPVDADELTTYNMDWMRKYTGASSLVLRPRNAQELSAIMKHCYERDLAVVPQGGNTGLVGGGVPVFDEIVISTALMNNVRNFDQTAGTLVADAGCVLEVLDNYLAERGYMMPLDLGAKGSCHIGGNVATNAGGLRFLRYGTLHGNVLGLEVVLPDGTILDGLSTLRKDNTGYDLKQLFIGSEGTLGIITGVSIITPKRPNAVNVAVFGVPSFEAIQKVFKEVKTHCGEVLSAFEFFDEHACNLVLKHASAGVRDPFEEKHPFYVLIETSGSRKEHDDEKLESLLETLMESSLISDGVLAQDETQLTTLWALRESIAEAAGKLGSVFKYDVSIPIDKMNELTNMMRDRLRETGFLKEELGDGRVITCVGYGHIGDGNLHINIVADSFDPEIEAAIEPYVYECVAKFNGSISAEHGLGLMKATKIHYSKPPVAVDYMKRLKHVFDPKGILNPYKYIRE